MSGAPGWLAPLAHWQSGHSVAQWVLIGYSDYVLKKKARLPLSRPESFQMAQLLLTTTACEHLIWRDAWSAVST